MIKHIKKLTNLQLLFGVTIFILVSYFGFISLQDTANHYLNTPEKTQYFVFSSSLLVFYFTFHGTKLLIDFLTPHIPAYIELNTLLFNSKNSIATHIITSENSVKNINLAILTAMSCLISAGFLLLFSYHTISIILFILAAIGYGIGFILFKHTSRTATRTTTYYPRSREFWLIHTQHITGIIDAQTACKNLIAIDADNPDLAFITVYRDFLLGKISSLPVDNISTNNPEIHYGPIYFPTTKWQKKDGDRLIDLDALISSQRFTYTTMHEINLFDHCIKLHLPYLSHSKDTHQDFIDQYDAVPENNTSIQSARLISSAFEPSYGEKSQSFFSDFLVYKSESFGNLKDPNTLKSAHIAHWDQQTKNVTPQFLKSQECYWQWSEINGIRWLCSTEVNRHNIRVGQWWLLALDDSHYVAIHVYQLDAQHKKENDLFSFLLNRLSSNIIQFINITSTKAPNEALLDKRTNTHFDNSPLMPQLSPRAFIEVHQKKQREDNRNKVEWSVIMLLIPLFAIMLYSGVALLFFNFEIGNFTGLSLIGHVVIMLLLSMSILGMLISYLKK